MADAKSLFDELKRRLDPSSRRAHASLPLDPIVVTLERKPPTAAVVPADETTALPASAGDMPEMLDTAPDSPAEVLTPVVGQALHDVVVSSPRPDGVDLHDAAAAPETATETALEPRPDAPSGDAPVIDEALAELKAARQMQPADVLPEAAFEAMALEIEALALEIDARDLTPPAEARLKGGNLLADVRAIAAGWFHNSRRRDRIHAGAGDIATPEELASAAAERGVEVDFRETPIRKLAETDFPCVALDKEGGSHILVGRPDSKTFLTQIDGTVTKVARKALETIASGVVFFVRPKPPAATDRPASRREAEPKKKSWFGIFGTVATEMFATQRKLLNQLALAALLSNLFTIALPMFSMAVYDRVIPHLAWETLWALSIGVLLILATDFALRYIRLKLLDAAGLSIATALQARLYSRIIHGKLKDAPSASGGMTNGFREVEALCHVIPALVVSIAVDIPFFILTCLLIYSIGGLVAITPLIGALALASVHVIGHLGEDAARKHSRYVGVQSNVLVETVGAFETVKVTGAERMLLRRWERLVDAASFASHINRLQGSFSGQASVVISQVVTVVALIIGVYEISTGAMTVGALTACTLLIGRLMTPVSQIMGLLHRTHQLASAAQMMERILSMPSETAGDSSEIREESPMRGELTFNGAGFTYPGEQAPCLKDISLTIRPGEKIGLIGRVGSGKSTLLRLILRMYDVDQGTILLDSQDVRQVSPRALRRHFGFMRQDSVLFDDTLQANLVFGLAAVNPVDFERAVAISGVREFASRHPQGYGMRVGPRGERLSGGERQSVAMARLFVENPPCMVFDEPTAAMDNALEARIVKDLRDYAKDKTMIIATHRAPLLSLVDRIIWLEGGRIVADGPKDEVMRRLTRSAA